METNMKDSGKMIKETDMEYTIIQMGGIKENGRMVNNKDLEYIIGKTVTMKLLSIWMIRLMVKHCITIKMEKSKKENI